MKSYEILRDHMRSNAILWNISWHLRNPLISYEIFWNPWKLNEILWRSYEILWIPKDNTQNSSTYRKLCKTSEMNSDAINLALPWKWVPIHIIIAATTLFNVCWRCPGHKPQIGWCAGWFGCQPFMYRLRQELHLVHETCRGCRWTITRTAGFGPGPHIPRPTWFPWVWDSFDLCFHAHRGTKRHIHAQRGIYT